MTLEDATIAWEFHVPADADSEVQALCVIASAVERLSHDAQVRVATWVLARATHDRDASLKAEARL